MLFTEGEHKLLNYEGYWDKCLYIVSTTEFIKITIWGGGGGREGGSHLDNLLSPPPPPPHLFEACYSNVRGSDKENNRFFHKLTFTVTQQVEIIDSRLLKSTYHFFV